MAGKSQKGQETPENIYLSAREAAAELGVSLATLYAYVSRDLIRSEPVPDSRAKRYRAEDIRKLKARRGGSPGETALPPGAKAGFGLGGQPVLESAITLISEGRLYYRGSDATSLAEHASLEQVATLLWGLSDIQPFTRTELPPWTPKLETLAAELKTMPRIERCLALLPVAALEDAAVYNMTERGLAATGARLLRLCAAIVAGEPPTAEPVHEMLSRSMTYGDRPGTELIRAALVLSADHELNASAFTVRCVAGTGSNLYAAMQAGICAAQGPKHGGLTTRVESFLFDLANRQDIEDAVIQRLRENDPPPGFGHWLYPNGDPRAECLLDMLARSHGDDAAWRRADRVRRVMAEAGGLKPNIDFAIAATGAVLRLPRGAALTLFVLGRMAGWIGHAMEQYRSGQMIRPRARYVGETPRSGL